MPAPGVRHCGSWKSRPSAGCCTMMLLRRWIFAICPLLFLPALAPAGEDKAKPAEGAFLAKPYLQIGRNPALGSLQVLWHAPDIEAEWSVEHRAGADRPWKKAGAATSRRVAVTGVEPHRVYRAALTGLEP